MTSNTSVKKYLNKYIKCINGTIYNIKSYYSYYRRLAIAGYSAKIMRWRTNERIGKCDSYTWLYTTVSLYYIFYTM